jgi:hypothetical protein
MTPAMNYRSASKTHYMEISELRLRKRQERQSIGAVRARLVIAMGVRGLMLCLSSTKAQEAAGQKGSSDMQEMDVYQKIILQRSQNGSAWQSRIGSASVLDAIARGVYAYGVKSIPRRFCRREMVGEGRLLKAWA